MKQFLLMMALYGCGMMAGYGLNDCKAQTYVVTTPQSQVAGYIQQNGQTVNVLTPNGNTVGQPYTVYPTQITQPSGYAIGTPSYSVPPTPPSPPSPRVLQ